jgi:uncharacterized protein YfaP (DUF2135 family)
LQLCFTEKTNKIVVLGRTCPKTITVHIFKSNKALESSFDLNGDNITPLGLECIEVVSTSASSQGNYDVHILYYFKEKHTDRVTAQEKDRVTMQYILPTTKKFKSIICSNFILGNLI